MRYKENMDTSLFTKKSKYLMLALDHRGSFKKMINPQAPEQVDDQEARELKARIIGPLAKHFSGALIDPVYGLAAYKQVFEGQDGIPPFLLSLEESGYEQEGADRYSKLQYKASELRAWGASGAKLLLYFDAKGKSAGHQTDVAKFALRDAQTENLPLFLEIVTYGKDREKSGVAKATINAMQMLKKAGVAPAVWKLEFPGSDKACAQVTKEAQGAPWILLTRGASFGQFTRELETAMQNGAAGFLAGRAVWQEVMNFQGAKQEQFLAETVPNRFAQISRIALS